MRIQYRGVDAGRALAGMHPLRLDGGRGPSSVGFRHIGGLWSRWVWEEDDAGGLGVWDRDAPAEPIARYAFSERREAQADVQARAWNDVRHTFLPGERWWIERRARKTTGRSGRVLLHYLSLPAVAHIAVSDRLTDLLTTHGALPPGTSIEQRMEHMRQYGGYQNLECSIDDVDGAKQAFEWYWDGSFELGSWQPVPTTLPRSLEATLAWIEQA